MDLLQPMRVQFSRSKQLWYRHVLPIGIVVYVTALVAALPWPGWVAGILAIGAVLAQSSAFALRLFADNCYNEAEGIRRRVMLQDGIGMAPSPAQLAKLHERTADIQTPEASLDRTYYDSEEPKGPRRLLDIIAEAAFFTSSLARRTWKTFAATAIVGLAASVTLMLVAALFHASESSLEVTARIVITSAAFWATGDIAAMAWQFFQLSGNAERLLDQSEALLRHGNPAVADALVMYAEYNCVLVKAPPIPFRVYTAYRDRLNQAWKERQIALQGRDVPG